MKCTRFHLVSDPSAVAVKKPDTGETVGHVPKKISRLCSSFLQQGYALTATVTGRRRYSSDLVQGGLEIPCDLRFVGDEILVDNGPSGFGRLECGLAVKYFSID